MVLYAVYISKERALALHEPMYVPTYLAGFESVSTSVPKKNVSPTLVILLEF